MKNKKFKKNQLSLQQETKERNLNNLSNKILKVSLFKNKKFLKNHRQITEIKNMKKDPNLKNRLIHLLESSLQEVESMRNKLMIMKNRKKFIEIYRIVGIDLVIWIVAMTVMKKIQDQVYMRQEEALDCNIE